MTLATLIPPAAARDATAEAAAMAVLDDYMTAFNAKDVAAWEATFHFPHYRFAGGRVAVLEKAGTRPALFDRLRDRPEFSDWDRSAWTHRTIIHSGPDKVHVDTGFARYRADGSVIARFDSIYVVTLEDGRWGVKARSSFAP